MAKNSTDTTQFSNWNHAPSLAALVILGFVMFILAGCDNQQSELAERGGGFAILKNGELVGISKDGSLGESCNLCTVGEKQEDCKARADKRGIELCEDVFLRVGDDTYSNGKDTQSSLEIISSARAANHVQMCDVLEPGVGPAQVPKTSNGNGYECWEDYGRLGAICKCDKL